MEQILFVEDDDILRQAASDILAAEGYQVVNAQNGQEALDALNHIVPDLIVSDISMPRLDGFELLEAIRSTERGMTIPFLFISASTEAAKISQARRRGADDYLFKPFELQELLDAVRARLDRRHQVLLFDTRDAHLQTVKMLANAIEARDIYTRGHVERVCKYALRLADYIGWSHEQIAELEFGATLHDVGKILVPEDILNKPGPLSEEERLLLRRHVEIGAQMLEGITHLKAVVPYILYHHERWDGSGYPRGLTGENIPLQGRVLAIADSFDAMTTERPYREAILREVAIEEIRSKRGILYDPDLAESFCQTITDEIRK
jgi:putative two-component system response regulator